MKGHSYSYTLIHFLHSLKRTAVHVHNTDLSSQTCADHPACTIDMKPVTVIPMEQKTHVQKEGTFSF
jgi:hypothetical protein